jgi:hypothetical protein
MSFLMSTFNCTEQPKKEQNISRRKELMKKRQEVETQEQIVLTLGQYHITKFIHRLDGPLGENKV